MIRLLLALILATSVLSPAAAQVDAEAKVTVRVVDEEGRPVEDAQITMCFFGGCRDKDIFRELTDSKGFFTESALSSDGRVGGSVKKKGYYSSSFHYAFTPFNKKFDRWQPWNKHLTVVLRQIGNPVPMYVRNRWFSVPMLGEGVGFDLMKADWVIPYGQGVTADFIIKTERKITEDERDSKLTITFSNEHDGIQLIKEDRGIFNLGSRYRLPRTAPEDEYLPQYVVHRYTGPKWGIISRDETNNFIFRVRTEVDDEGRIVKALYGKILGDFRFAPLEGNAGDFLMHYYLNPDGTRNLEFDTERNLFPKGRGEALP
jgi:hypothetical protein